MRNRRYSLIIALFSLVPLFAGGRGMAQDRPAIPMPHDPSHADDAAKWCVLHMTRQELVAAVSDCDYAVARDPKNVTALSNRGSVWLVAGEPAWAIVDFNAALALAPDNPSFYFNRGIAHTGMKSAELAITDYTEAIRLKPDLAIAFHNRGYEYERLSRPTEALADYKRALDIDRTLKPSIDAVERLMRGRL